MAIDPWRLVRPATPADIDFVAPRMRSEDVAEVWASSHSTPREALEVSLLLSDAAFCGELDGKPAVLFGVTPASLISDVGIPWLLGTDAVRRWALTFWKHSVFFLGLFRRNYSFLFNYVDVRNRTSIAWLKRLGFSFAPAAPYGPDNALFHRFAMRCSNV